MRSARVILGLVVLVAAACGFPRLPELRSTCGSDGSCPDGTTCVTGLCEATCGSDRACPSGLSCRDGVCADDSAPAPTRFSRSTYLKAANAAAGDQFGHSVALSADGTTLAIGAFQQAGGAAAGTGAVYVFIRAGASWSQEAYLKPSELAGGDQFGTSLALSADGSTLAIGAPAAASGVTAAAGVVFLFRRIGGLWGKLTQIASSNPDSGDHFGDSVALAGDGLRLMIGAPGEASASASPKDNAAPAAGAAYQFEPLGRDWSSNATVSSYIKSDTPVAGERFGACVALSADGFTQAIGSARDEATATTVGTAYVVTDNGNSWTVQPPATDRPLGAFGNSVAVAMSGSLLAVGAPGRNGNGGQGAGAVYLFALQGAQWAVQALLESPHPSAGGRFGDSVALSADGATLAVGGDLEASGAGAAYVFTRSGSAWSLTSAVAAFNAGAGDGFGASVALSADGTALAIGAAHEDGGATATAERPDNAAGDAGSVYVYQ